jgi:hyperosmotically inducible protein
MKIRMRVATGVFGAVLLALAGMVVARPATAGSTTKPDITNIESQVRHKLVMLPWYGVFDNLEYQVNGTEVTLTGQVLSEHDRTKYDAETDVKRIPGVTKVINNIEVLPPSPFDDQIRRAEFRTIFSRSDLGRYTLGAIPQVHIIVRDGHVFLEGVVINQMDKQIAEMAANSVPGVFSVTNNLRID